MEFCCDIVKLVYAEIKTSQLMLASELLKAKQAISADVQRLLKIEH